MRRSLALAPERPVCTDLEPACFQLVFCEAVRCAVDLRRGLAGELTRCPVSGVDGVVGYTRATRGRQRRR